MKTLYPFQIVNLSPDGYDKYQKEIRRQQQIIELYNFVMKHETKILTDIITDVGMNKVLDSLGSKYDLLSGNDVMQIVHQSITWPENLKVPPIGVDTDGKMLTILHANHWQ